MRFAVTKNANEKSKKSNNDIVTEKSETRQWIALQCSLNSVIVTTEYRLCMRMRGITMYKLIHIFIIVFVHFVYGFTQRDLFLFRERTKQKQKKNGTKTQTVKNGEKINKYWLLLLFIRSVCVHFNFQVIFNPSITRCILLCEFFFFHFFFSAPFLRYAAAAAVPCRQNVIVYACTMLVWNYGSRVVAPLDACS